MAKAVLIVLAVFILGALGGIWAQAFLLPYLAGSSAFQDLQFIKDWNARTIFAQPVSKISVDQAVALENAAEKAQRAVVRIASAGRQGSGLAITSDGLILTRASLVPAGYAISVFVEREETGIAAQVLKRDALLNLALLKIEKTNLPTAGFAQEEEVQPGTFLFLLAKNNKGESVINQGVARSFEDQRIQTTMTEKSLVGASVFTLEGRVAGLAAISPEGSVSIIPASLLRPFLGL